MEGGAEIWIDSKKCYAHVREAAKKFFFLVVRTVHFRGEVARRPVPLESANFLVKINTKNIILHFTSDNTKQKPYIAPFLCFLFCFRSDEKLRQTKLCPVYTRTKPKKGVSMVKKFRKKG